MAEDCLSQEPTLLELDSPIICGAILGDLQHLQSLQKSWDSQTPLLFLGNYLPLDEAKDELEALGNWHRRC